jgi:D-lactate dehydrogenase (cytochrome)
MDTAENSLVHQGNLGTDYPDYLRDESRRAGHADSISFPRSEADIRRVLAWAGSTGVPITIQGARTGITGGATPDGGHILNLSTMKAMTGLRPHPHGNGYLLRVQPGVRLSDIQSAAARCDFDTRDWSAESMAALDALRGGNVPHFFPPDPTETTAAVGGATACNASGARSFAYGPTRAHVHGLRVVLADGDVLVLERGRERAARRTFELRTESGRIIRGDLPTYRMPDVKSAAGLFVRDDMDMVDLFIGAEGTLGVLSEIEIHLLPQPAVRCGLTVFLPDEASALDLVRRGREATTPVAIEFVNHSALDLLRQQRVANPAFADIPELPRDWHSSVYFEFHEPSQDEAETAIETLAELIDACGGDADATWMADTAHDLERFKAFRHAIPEAVNLQIDVRRKTEPALTKLGTDLSVPDGRLEEVMRLYRDDLAQSGLEHVCFGHIGNNHVHVNILPRTMAEYDTGKQLYLQWATKVVAMGGSVSAEHGIGKLKVAMLETMFGGDGIDAMRRVKRTFDPHGLLNRGNLFTWES